MSDDHPGETFAYRLRQHMNGAVRQLRDAEDFARMEMPGWPTADRIRDIYEQITDDILNGRTTVPPLKQRLATAEADLAAAQERANRGDRGAARFMLFAGLFGGGLRGMGMVLALLAWIGRRRR